MELPASGCTPSRLPMSSHWYFSGQAHTPWMRESLGAALWWWLMDASRLIVAPRDGRRLGGCVALSGGVGRTLMSGVHESAPDGQPSKSGRHAPMSSSDREARAWSAVVRICAVG